MATKISARERKLQVLLKDIREKYSALQAEHEDLWSDFEIVQRFSAEQVDAISDLKKKYEPKSLPRKLTELEQVIRQHVAENLDDTNKLPWVVATGTESASTKIGSVVALLSSKVNGDEEVLVKTLRVARNAVLHVYEGVRDRECAAMLQCPCIRGEWQHHEWPHYTAGCFAKESDRHGRIGGRLWDVVEFLRLHSGYENPKLVAHTTILALKQIASELQSKEEDLLRLVSKIQKSNDLQQTSIA